MQPFLGTEIAIRAISAGICGPNAFIRRSLAPSEGQAVTLGAISDGGAEDATS